MTSRWPLAAWVMAGLLAVIAVAAPNIPDGNGDQVRADLTSADDTGIGVHSRPDRLAFNDQEPDRGLDTDANILSPLPETNTNSNMSAPDPDRSTSTTSANTDPRPSTTVPSPSTSIDDSSSNDSGGGADDGSASGEDRNPAADEDGSEGDDQATGGNESLVERYYNDFSLGRLDIGNWELDDGPAPTGFGLHRPSAVSVVADPTAAGGHVLQVSATMASDDENDQVISGAMTLVGFGQTYGRYSARVRIDSDPAQVTSGALVLSVAGTQPVDERIGFFETWANRSTRTPVEAYLHADSQRHGPFLVETHTGISGTDWHVYRVEWQKDRVTVTVDDRQSAVLSTDPAAIPDGNLDLTIRLHAYESPLTPGLPPMLTEPVRLQIDWLLIESRRLEGEAFH